MTTEGDPLRVSICHCLACQRRTGSAFGVQSRFNREQVRITGRSREFVRTADEDDEPRTSHFCPECGTTVYIVNDSTPDTLVIPVGAFAEPGFPPPTISVWEDRKHDWVTLPVEIQHVP